MPLDVGYPRADGSLDVRFRFDEDGTYEFLNPWFIEVENATGKCVDLYGEAAFHESSGLNSLAAVLVKARAAAVQQPSTWRVHAGTQLRPQRKELYRTMNREPLVASIDRLIELLREAAASQLQVVFRGD